MKLLENISQGTAGITFLKTKTFDKFFLNFNFLGKFKFAIYSSILYCFGRTLINTL
jgi:hypothetical protein